MSFGDRLKSWFVIEDESAAKDKEKEGNDKGNSGAKESTIAKSSNAQVPKTTNTASAEPGKVTAKFMDILLAAMDKQNLDGFDYLEYKQSLKSLENMPMDEETRYKSAYAMAKTMGATPAKLIKTADHYVKVLMQEEKKFGQALVAQRTKQVGGRENQIKQLEKGIQQKAQQIKKLTTEIEQDQKKLEKIKGDISGAVIKVETTKNNFMASFNSLVGQIQQDIAKMKQYLEKKE